MSRSYKKPWTKDGQDHSKRKAWAKRLSSRILRGKLKDPEYEIADGSAFKNGESLNSWDICDWRYRTMKPLDTEVSRKWGLGVVSVEEQKENYRKATTK